MARIGCLLVLLGGLAVAAPGVDEERFLSAQGRCRFDMRAKKWAEARERYATLLREHEGRDYVRRRRSEIEDDLKLCAFHATYRAPEAKTLLGPEVARFDPSTRQIELRMTGKFTRGLWTKQGKSHRVSTLVFEGDLEAMNPPRPFFFCFDPVRGDGYAYRRHRDPRATMRLTLSRRESGKESLLAHGDLPGESLRLVRKGSLILLYDRERNEPRETVRLRAKDGRFRVGRIALRKGACVIRGRVTKESWAQRLREHESRAFRSWCETSWDPARALPAWLRSDAPTPVHVASRLPGDVPPGRADAVRAAVTCWRNGDPAPLRATVSTMPPGLRTTAFLGALLALSEGRSAEAAALASGVLAREPTFGPAHAVLAAAHLRMRDGSALEPALAAAKRLAPDDPLTVSVEAQAALVGRDVERADAVLQGAIRRGVRTKPLDSMARSIHRSLSGPSWSRRHPTPTERFVVETDHSFAASRDVAKRIDLALAAYARWFGKAPPAKGRARVRLFSTRGDYEAYGKALEETFAGSAGVYLPHVRELVLLYRADESATLDGVIRHEGFHWYVHEIVDELPIWFDEGHAMCFETAERPGGPPAPRSRNEVRVLELRAVRAAGRLLSARELMLMDARTFMRGAHAHYPQAWALVHLLRTSEREELRGTLDAYLAAIRKGRSQQQAFDDVYAPVIRQVEARFGKLVKDLTSRR